jgi:hypothetical protein
MFRGNPDIGGVSFFTLRDGAYALMPPSPVAPFAEAASASPVCDFAGGLGGPPSRRAR